MPSTSTSPTRRIEPLAAGGAASPSSTWKRFPIVPLAFLAAFLALLGFPTIHSNARMVVSFVSIAAFLLTWMLVLGLRARRAGRVLAIEALAPLKSHYIQASMQLCIYTYWGMYWPRVAIAAPLIVAQLLFLYVLDALISWSRGRDWRLGFGPVPIILSTNLFMWFKDDWFALQFALIATCALGKEFIKWHRDGRWTHVFNPSAFGLAVCSVVLIATGTTQYTWGIEVATTLAYAPHMYLLIFAVGLVVQYFFAVTLMTLSAVAVLYLYNVVYTQVTGVYHFVDTNIPIAVFLGLHLLMTDPATTPRSNSGRIVFGGLYGLANIVLFTVLGKFGVPDFYDKLLPVPILNLSVKWIDRFASLSLLQRFDRFEARFLPKRVNYAHMGVWIALFALMVSTGFVEAPHPGASIAFWRKAYEEGKPSAGLNWMKMVGSHAEAGSAVACNQLATIYMEGKIVPQDRRAAAFYFAQACELGSAQGCQNVAAQFLTYGEARSLEDATRALDLLEAHRHNAPDGRAAFLLGRAYAIGRGRPVDAQRALECYRESVARGSLDGSKALVEVWLAGGCEGSQLAKAGAALEAASDKGDAESGWLLGCMYERGAGVARDEARSRSLLQAACSRGSRPACEKLQSLAPASAESQRSR